MHAPAWRCCSGILCWFSAHSNHAPLLICTKACIESLVVRQGRILPDRIWPARVLPDSGKNQCTWNAAEVDVIGFRVGQ